MIQTIESKVFAKIKKARRGTLFFIDDFIRFGNTKTIGKTLDRLSKEGELKRLAPGIFYRPEISGYIGELTPGIEDVARAIARRDKARIVPTGAYALNKLGLSTQVPMNIVYYTDGSARKVKIGNNTITFKKTSPKNLGAIGSISKLVIQALKSIGKESVSQQVVQHVQSLLRNEKITALEHDIRLAPEWIRQIMKPTLKNLEDE